MAEEVITLTNQNRSILCADEALDFNFNESDEPDDPNENKIIPYIHFFQRPLKPNNLIVVDGTVLKYAKGFKIDLYSHNNNVALHINPRLDQNYIARNSWQEGTWGSEESCSPTKSPIQRGKPYQFQIFVLEKEFMVSINGEHMFNYFHRIPYSEINRIEIFGDTDVTNVAFTMSPAYPLPNRKEFTKLDFDLSLPLKYHIKYGLSHHRKISIEGRVKLLPISFTINIQTTDEVFPHPKIIYHLNARYSLESYVVENSWGMKGEGWDSEVRSPMPHSFAPGSDFSLCITSNNSYLETKGPDWKFPPFYHRLNPENGLFLIITGDIFLKSLKINPDPDTVSLP